MAIARLSTGEVFTHYSDINEMVKPLQVGRFSFPLEVEQNINALTKPLTKDGVDYIIGTVHSDAEAILKDAGFEFKSRRVGCYVPPETRGGECSFTRTREGQTEVDTVKMTEDDLAGYLTPHNVHVNDWHFTCSGAIVKGIQLEADLQAVVYVSPGEWIRLAPTVLNWPIFAFGTPVIGPSYYDRAPNADGKFDMDMHPDHPVLETMRF